MPEPVVLKATSKEETGTYSVKDKHGKDLFSVSANNETGKGTVYDNKNNPVLKIQVE